jgi:hypothetical protein
VVPDSNRGASISAGEETLCPPSTQGPSGQPQVVPNTLAAMDTIEESPKPPKTSAEQARPDLFPSLASMGHGTRKRLSALAAVFTGSRSQAKKSPPDQKVAAVSTVSMRAADMAVADGTTAVDDAVSAGAFPDKESDASKASKKSIALRELGVSEDGSGGAASAGDIHEGARMRLRMRDGEAAEACARNCDANARTVSHKRYTQKSEGRAEACPANGKLAGSCAKSEEPFAHKRKRRADFINEGAKAKRQRGAGETVESENDLADMRVPKEESDSDFDMRFTEVVRQRRWGGRVWTACALSGMFCTCAMSYVCISLESMRARCTSHVRAEAWHAAAGFSKIEWFSSAWRSGGRCTARSPNLAQPFLR